jgi:hypothetical protein
VRLVANRQDGKDRCTMSVSISSGTRGVAAQGNAKPCAAEICIMIACIGMTGSRSESSFGERSGPTLPQQLRAVVPTVHFVDAEPTTNIQIPDGLELGNWLGT